MAKPKIKFSYFLFGLLLGLICVLRLWKATAWFSFNYDEEYQAFLAWSQVLNFHPIWIGVSAGNTGFYLGPAFTYLNALLFLFSKGDPAILAYFSPIIGLVSIASIYYVVSKIFSKNTALYSSLIYALSPLLNFFDRRFWNPSLIPFLTIWLLFSLYKLKEDTRWLILSSIIMATALHVHLSLLVFWPIIIYVVILQFKKIHFSTWLTSIIAYLVVVSPLIVYDKVHNFDNLRTPIRMLATKGDVPLSNQISTHFISIWNSLSRFWYLQPHTTIQAEMGFPMSGSPTRPIFILSVFSLLIIIFLFFKARLDKKYILLFSMTLISLLAFLLFPGLTLEYYLLCFFTLLSISGGLFLSVINQKISWLIIFIFSIFSAITVFTCEQSKYGLMSRKEKIVNIFQKNPNKQYSVTFDPNRGVPYSTYGGWCYLFQVYAGKFSSCPSDESFGWIYGTSKSHNIDEIKINLVDDLNLQND